MSQKEHCRIININDRLDDMIFSCELHKKAFAKNRETNFNLSHVNKVLMNIFTKQATNGKNIANIRVSNLIIWNEQKLVSQRMLKHTSI